MDVELTSNTAYFDLVLYDHNQLRVDAKSFILSDGVPATVSWTATAAGHFYIKVILMRSSGTYSMTVNRAGNEPPEAMFEWWMEGETLIVLDISQDVDGEVVEDYWYIDGVLQGEQVYGEFLWVW